MNAELLDRDGNLVTSIEIGGHEETALFEDKSYHRVADRKGTAIFEEDAPAAPPS